MPIKSTFTSFIVLLAYFPLPSQATLDPCSAVSSIESNISTEPGIKRSILRIYKKIHRLVSGDYFQKLTTDEDGVYFTRNTGFYFTLDCSYEDSQSETISKKRLTKIGIYGVGDLFKPVAKKTFTDGIYYYGKMRSGLHAFVNFDHLRKFSDDKVYLFNKTSDPIQFCTNGIYCKGLGKEFSRRTRYATTALNEFSRKINTGKCEKLNVDIFNGNSDQTSYKEPNPIYKNANLEYCHHNRENGIFATTSRQAHWKFESLPIQGKFFNLSAKSLKEKIPFIFTHKPCRTETAIKKDSVLALGGSIGIGGELKLIKGEANAKPEISWGVHEKEVFNNDMQYFYQTYTISPTPNTLTTEASNFVNDIEVVQTCIKGTSKPDKLADITIHLFPQNQEVISIDVQDLDKTARNKLSTKIYARTSLKKKGKTWRIRGLKQNDVWKAFLWERIRDEIPDIFADEEDVELKNSYVDYFTDLFIAIAFDISKP